jgi:hypothetical protein
MELIGYVVDWAWLQAEYAEPRASDHLFRLMDDGSDRIVSPGPLQEERSASYSSAIGELFVELVEEGRLPDEVARALGAFLVTFCPQVTELDGYSPPVDMSLGDTFYAVAGPETLRDRLAPATPAALRALKGALREQADDDGSDDAPSADEAMDYIGMWRGVMAGLIFGALAQLRGCSRSACSAAPGPGCASATVSGGSFPFLRIRDGNGNGAVDRPGAILGAQRGSHGNGAQLRRNPWRRGFHPGATRRGDPVHGCHAGRFASAFEQDGARAVPG